MPKDYRNSDYLSPQMSNPLSARMTEGRGMSAQLGELSGRSPLTFSDRKRPKMRLGGLLLSNLWTALVSMSRIYLSST